ncbi:glycoside hydrolase family 30 protein [Parasediminibacterium sp. JCM 36343]|uniref:glycoside hydrolase family 30 protein n=1 Tax=Parasediminibacterium sp. JCM 36343 TaxID=3374279 RepID=UPI0039788255
MKKIIIGLVGFCAFGVQAQKVKWVSTTDSARWQAHPTLQLKKLDGGVNDSLFLIDVSQKAQQITGWGGCFNELGWKALQVLDEKDREAVLKALFDQKEGSKFNICRTPMAASDFALDAYSYDDFPDDYEMKHFSIERDKKTLIPFIKAAMKYSPKLTVWASPWSPPAWMKTNNNYAGGSLKFEPKIFQAYALYQEKYVQEYQKAGVPLVAIHPQNEPIIKSKYPSCQWLNADSMRDYIKNYLGPKFKEDKVPAQIWLGTITNSDTNWFKKILDDKEAAAYISGLGLQYNSLKALTFLRKNYNLPMMETETRCYNGKNTWKEGEDTYGLMYAYLKGGCQAYMYWNMVLDETGKSSWDWSQNSSVVVDTKNKTFSFTPQFYVMKHFSAFVAPGAYLLTPNKANDNAIIFQNPNGSIAVVVANKGTTTKKFSCSIGGKVLSVDLEAKSYNTFLIGK